MSIEIHECEKPLSFWHRFKNSKSTETVSKEPFIVNRCNSSGRFVQGDKPLINHMIDDTQVEQEDYAYPEKNPEKHIADNEENFQDPELNNIKNEITKDPERKSSSFRNMFSKKGNKSFLLSGGSFFFQIIHRTLAGFKKVLNGPRAWSGTFLKKKSLHPQSLPVETTDVEFHDGLLWTSTQELWATVSKHQLRTSHAAIQAGLPTTTCDQKKLWLESIAHLLQSNKLGSDRLDIIRSAAIDGNLVQTCLKIVQNVNNVFYEQDSEIVRVALWLLQDLYKNVKGAQVFYYLNGPAIVHNRLKSYRITCESLEEEEKNKYLLLPQESVWVKCPSQIEMYCIKLSYKILLSSCISDATCADEWVSDNILRLSLTTLGPEVKFIDDVSYVELALTVIRVIISKSTSKNYQTEKVIETCLSMIRRYPANQWVVESAFAVIASVQESDPRATDYLKENGSAIWNLIISCCTELQVKGHVLYQGLRVLRHACSSSKDILLDVEKAGGLQLVDCVLPEQRDAYIEKILPVAIELKQLFSPIDFEALEIQKFLAHGRFDNSLEINNFSSNLDESLTSDGAVDKPEVEESANFIAPPRTEIENPETQLN